MKGTEDVKRERERERKVKIQEEERKERKDVRRKGNRGQTGRLTGEAKTKSVRK